MQDVDADNDMRLDASTEWHGQFCNFKAARDAGWARREELQGLASPGDGWYCNASESLTQFDGVDAKYALRNNSAFWRRGLMEDIPPDSSTRLDPGNLFLIEAASGNVANYSCLANCLVDFDCSGACGGLGAIDRCGTCQASNPEHVDLGICTGCTDPSACNYAGTLIEGDWNLCKYMSNTSQCYADHSHLLRSLSVPTDVDLDALWVEKCSNELVNFASANAQYLVVVVDHSPFYFRPMSGSGLHLLSLCELVNSTDVYLEHEVSVGHAFNWTLGNESMPATGQSLLRELLEQCRAASSQPFLLSERGGRREVNGYDCEMYSYPAPFHAGCDIPDPRGSARSLDCSGKCTVATDCLGVCNGTAAVDACGVCAGDNSSCTGCTDSTALNFDSYVHTKRVAACLHSCMCGNVIPQPYPTALVLVCLAPNVYQFCSFPRQQLRVRCGHHPSAQRQRQRFSVPCCNVGLPWRASGQHDCGCLWCLWGRQLVVYRMHRP